MTGLEEKGNNQLEIGMYSNGIYLIFLKHNYLITNIKKIVTEDSEEYS
jgi:hypothetical protein